MNDIDGEEKGHHSSSGSQPESSVSLHNCRANREDGIYKRAATTTERVVMTTATEVREASEEEDGSSDEC